MLKGKQKLWGKKSYPITKTCLYKFDPLKPHIYIIKLGFTGVYIIFLISAQNIDCWYSLEPPHRGGSNEYPQSMFWAEVWKISEFFIWKFPFFFYGKIFSISCMRVFVMHKTNIYMYLISKALHYLYGIQINYRTYPYKRTVKQFGSLQITAHVLLSTSL